MPQTQITCGVIFIAAGGEYVKDACASARTLREHSPGLQIDIYCDVTAEVEAGLFDQVHQIENPHKRSKVDYIWRSRFDRVLYLDTDTRIVADISNLFDLLDRFDICATHAHSRERDSTNQTWRIAIPKCFPQLNGGVLLFRNSESVQAMLKEWADAYHSAGFKRDQVTLRELVWRSNLDIYILPPEYNIRYAKYIDVWEEHEAHPKILHFPDYATARSRKSKSVLASLFKRK